MIFVVFVGVMRLRLSVPVCKTIYAEGMVFLPPEVAAGLASWRRAREIN